MNRMPSNFCQLLYDLKKKIKKLNQVFQLNSHLGLTRLPFLKFFKSLLENSKLFKPLNQNSVDF